MSATNTSDGSARLRIAQIAPLWASVPPKSYGGAELMVHWLTEELVRLGHDVTLFASGDSRTSARLVPVCHENLMDAMERGSAYTYEPYVASAFADALRASQDFDVLHSHVGASLLPLGVLSRAPVVHTVHAGLDAVDEQWILARCPEAQIAAISDSQVAAIPAARRGSIRTIYHGCDFDRYRFATGPGRHLAFVGRMGPQKNPAGAIRIARALGMPLVMAGRPQTAKEREYFKASVAPLVDGREVVHLGAVSHEEKVELLAGAAALLTPIQWDEHFGLIMIEAMACGTPVVGQARGSVPEVVDPGVTGFHGTSEEELTALVPKAIALDRARVREHALARFGHRRMAADYVDLYRSLLARMEVGA